MMVVSCWTDMQSLDRPRLSVVSVPTVAYFSALQWAWSQSAIGFFSCAEFQLTAGSGSGSGTMIAPLVPHLHIVP